nr:type II toxin-antitoxin system Phd/YefM family antitoxin [Actinomycetales bacterium]
MRTEPLREVRDHFSEVIDAVEKEHERVTVTRNGKPVAVIMSVEDLESLEETLDVLSDPPALAEIREGLAAYEVGDVVRGTDAILALRPRP